MAKRYKAYGVDLLRAAIAGAFPPIESAHTTAGHRYKRTDTGKYAWSVTTKQGFVNKGYLHKWYAKRAAEHVRENLPRLLAGDLSVLDEAAGAGERSRDASADIGTTAHGAIDRYCTRWIHERRRPSGSASAFLAGGSKGEEIAACRSFDRFLDEVDITPVASETRVWYEHGRDSYAGTVDIIFILRRPHKGRVGKPECKAIDNIGAHDYERQESGILWCIECGREVEERLILGDWKTSNSIKDKDSYAEQDVAYGKAIEKAAKIKFDEYWVVRFSKAKAEYEICKVRDVKQAWKEFVATSRAFDAKESRGEVGLLESLEVKESIKI